MKTILLVSAFIAGFILITPAQVRGNYDYDDGGDKDKNARTYTKPQPFDRNAVTKASIANSTEVMVTVNGLMNVIAENYVAVFNTVQVGETAEETDRLLNERISGFIKGLKAAGIDTADIRIDMLTFVPIYDYQVEKRIFSKMFNEVPAGFELQKNIHVRYKNSAKLDEILSVAAAAEIYDLVKVDYFVSDIQKAHDTLRDKCIQQIKSKLKSYELIGFKLDTLYKVMADDYTTTYPSVRYQSYQAFARPSLDAAKKRTFTGGEAKVNEVRKSVSQYYEQISYDDYDVVINPVVTEPVVQFSYSVTVKYILEPKQLPEPINNYFMLTSDGQVKQLNLR